MSEIQELSIEERIRLVGAIWDSIAADTASVPVDPEHMEVIKARLKTYRVDLESGDLARDVAERVRRSL